MASSICGVGLAKIKTTGVGGFVLAEANGRDELVLATTSEATNQGSQQAQSRPSPGLKLLFVEGMERQAVIHG
jgi:hypothetical protein